MQRRDVLERSGAALTTTLAVGLAGCSGDDSGSDDSGDDDGDGDGDSEGTATPEPSAGESMGSVSENTVEGLELVDWQSEIEDDQYKVTLTVKNTGDKETTAFDYNYELKVFDSDGNDITSGFSGTGALGGTTISPGEETEINVRTGVETSVDDVASYEIILNCDGFGGTAEGVYCQE